MKNRFLQKHVKQTCLFCEKTGFFSRFLQDVATHTMEKGYLCQQCPEEFRTPHQLSRHMNTSHKKPLLYSCVFCENKFLNQQTLNGHLITHTGEKGFGCAKCKKEYGRRQELTRHIKKSCNKPAQFFCVFCEKELVTKLSLCDHLYSHIGENWFNCDKCSESFNTRARLDAHRSTHFVQCTICRIKFKSSKGLRGHFGTVHSIKGPWKCSQCPVNCRSQSAYDIHMRKHTGEKPFACDKCPRRFTRKNLLRLHMDSHDPSKLREWLCQQCGRQSYSKTEHLVHMNTHRKPYSCDICDKRLSRKKHLETHIRGHTGERPYKCNMCPKIYRAKGQLTRHKNSSHGLQPKKH